MISIPAVSQAQQRMMGFLSAHPKEAKRRGMSASTAREFARVKGKLGSLPKRKKFKKFLDSISNNIKKEEHNPEEDMMIQRMSMMEMRMSQMEQKMHEMMPVEESMKVSKSFNGNFGLIMDLQKDFQITELSDKRPDIFSKIDLDKGYFTWGVASTEKMDSDGETVHISDEVLNRLTTPPYNKVFHSHNHTDIASGKIVFAGRIDNTPVILEQMNEDHPSFKNYLGSIKNGFIDSYSIGGNATSKVVNGKKVREVTDLKEVSRTSLPANPDAMIGGYFMVKMSKGAYFYKEKKQEGGNMSEKDNVAYATTEQFNDLKKNMEDMNNNFKSFIDGMKKSMEEDVSPEEPASVNNPNKDLDALRKELEDLKKANEELKKANEDVKKTLKMPVGRQSEVTDNKEEPIMKGYDTLRFNMYNNMFKQGFQGSVI